jgi:hypothetical protein
MANLDQVLSAARAPATASELSHEAAVVATFEGAHRVPVTTAGRPSMLKSTLAKLAAAKVVAAAAAAAILASGGLALAASSGHLPNPLSHSDRATTGDAHATAAAGKPSSTPTHPTESPSESASASPTPSLKGLCTAYQAGSTDNDGSALTSPAFKALVTAAGGAGQVAGYCTTLIGTPTPHPTSHPTGAPTAHPTGVPTSHPTDAATSHPTGAPSGVPTSHPSGAPAH